jgi:hypothetical protein
MEFSKHDLYTVMYACAVAHDVKIKQLRRKQRASEGRKRNLRPGALASLAMEASDYEQLFRKLEAELLPEKKEKV